MNNVAEWSLRDKIGQMVICGFDGKRPSGEILALIRDYRIGGIVYFRRNIGRAAEVARLSAELREAASAVTKAPLLIAVDQEGGMVARIDRDTALMPGNMAIGATRDASLAYEAARVSGAELAAMGITMNFAPCLDVNNNPANPVIGVRSYGERPELVAELGAAAIAGFQESGVSACVKHFPGHGDTAVDSHLAMPIVPHDRERLSRVELVPFRRAIAAGVDAIMTAHVRFPAYEKNGWPATLSPAVLNGLLRGQLGFAGVIVTDCLEMKAISGERGIGAAAVAAVRAGADLVLISHSPDRQREALEALYAAAASGEIAPERLDASVRRILAMKQRRALREGAADPAKIGSEAHRAVGRRICERAVTMVRSEPGALPLRRDVPTLAIWPEVRTATEVEEVIRQDMTLGAALGRYIGSVTELAVGADPTAEEIRAAVAAVRDGMQVVAGTYNASLRPGQIRLVKALLQTGRARVVVAALRNPYDLAEFPEAAGTVACYENRPAMMEALAKVLVGEIPASGSLPVTLRQTE